VAGVVGVGAGIGLVALAPWFALAVGLVLAGGLGEGFGGVAEQGLIQRRTPDVIRSRVVGATEAAVMVAFAASFAFGGPLVDAIGVRWTYAIGGLSCLAGAAIILPAMRQASAEAQRAPEAELVRP
jgi:MFS family permease